MISRLLFGSGYAGKGAERQRLNGQAVGTLFEPLLRRWGREGKLSSLEKLGSGERFNVQGGKSQGIPVCPAILAVLAVGRSIPNRLLMCLWSLGACSLYLQVFC